MHWLAFIEMATCIEYDNVATTVILQTEVISNSRYMQTLRRSFTNMKLTRENNMTYGLW